MSTKVKTTTVNPSKLAPNFDKIEGELLAEEHTFWLGVTADCPRGQIDVAGLHFPKSEEQIVLNSAKKQVRVPVLGALNKTVTRYHFEELTKVLSRLVIRPSKPLPEDSEDDPSHLAKGKLIKIPDAADIAGARENGRKLKPYVKRPGDRPAIEFMYFVHVPDGVRGNSYQTIADAGLEWPAEIELKALNDLMS